METPENNPDDVLTNDAKPWQFKKGNKLWELRETDGRSKVITEPVILFDHFIDYMADVDANPWTKNDFRGKDADEVTLEFKAPYTWNGFDNYIFALGLLTNLDDYKHNTGGAYNDFKDVIKRIDKIIYDQKITGATLGFFNHAIIAKELGLVEKKEMTTTTTILSLGSGIDPENDTAPLPEIKKADRPF